MSGTSLDGIDAVLLRLRGSGTSTTFRQIAFVNKPFPQKLKQLLLKNSVPATSRVDDIARLNVLLAELYADAVRSLAKRAAVRLSQIALIGSHGQTLHHLPQPMKMFGKTIRATLQIGDPSVLATLTGIPTVGDFRLADMVVGGQGAPLVPYFDWLVFRSKTKNRILLNIGGIANMTILPKNCSVDGIRAFDTGPGNMVVDSLMSHFYGKQFDRDGGIATKGMVVLELFRSLSKHSYLKKQPPKSTGREEFGEKFIHKVLKHAEGYDKHDVIATVSRLTPFAVYEGYRMFVERRMNVDEVIVSGGGAKNRFFMDELRRYFKSSKVGAIDEFGIQSDAKEAICFAVLANETMAGNPANIPAVTGAKKRVVLGKICRP
jgi:anhydro-N-acetylmuramic acid kinase